MGLIKRTRELKKKLESIGKTKREQREYLQNYWIAGWIPFYRNHVESKIEEECIYERVKIESKMSSFCSKNNFPQICYN